VAARPEYDLLVLIDGDTPEERRTQILDGIRKQIAAGDGEVKSDVDWGVRKLAFEIAHRGDAYYHLFQLESSAELLRQLEHGLSIDDAVLRHRIIRLAKGASENPPRPGPSAPRARAEADEPAAPAATETAPIAASSDASGPAEAATPEEDVAAVPQEESQRAP
jgi:small subunit ribosomal protein S6